jgi:hypothetical protein
MNHFFFCCPAAMISGAAAHPTAPGVVSMLTLNCGLVLRQSIEIDHLWTCNLKQTMISSVHGQTEADGLQ